MEAFSPPAMDTCETMKRSPENSEKYSLLPSVTKPLLKTPSDVS
jgi:hypothetical protein